MWVFLVLVEALHTSSESILQRVPLADMVLPVRVPVTVSMLLHVTWRLGVSARKAGLDPTATKVTHKHWICKH